MIAVFFSNYWLVEIHVDYIRNGSTPEEQQHLENMTWYTWIFLCCTTMYFLWLEAIVPLFSLMMQRGFRGLGAFFKSQWSYLEIAPNAMMTWQLSYGPAELVANDFVRALITFFIWFKLITWFRYMKTTGFLVRMIFECVKDAGPFFMIFFFFLIAFTDGTYTIGKYNW